MGRSGLSYVQKADLWNKWKNGQPLSEIDRALGKHARSIYGVLSSNGNIVHAPPLLFNDVEIPLKIIMFKSRIF